MGMLSLTLAALALSGCDQGGPCAFADADASTGSASTDAALSGSSTDAEACPTAVIQVKEGGQVTLQTVLHLDAEQSVAASGDVARYHWTVEQPHGSDSVLLPSDSVADPTFEADHSGTYTFCLEVWDTSGTKNCQIACTQVVVSP